MTRPGTQADALLVRARRLLADHRARAKRDGVVLPYDLADVRRLIAGAGVCTYCKTPLAWDVSLDHQVPIARGGRHELANLAPCCGRCNPIKGQLTAPEFALLLTVVVQLHPTARADVERRLLAGGRRYATRRT